MRKPLKLCTFKPCTSMVRTYKLALLRYDSVEDENLPLKEDDGWLPLEKMVLNEDNYGILCDMRFYVVRPQRSILPDRFTSTEPESIIRKEEILPFLTSLKEKNIRWPLFASPDEAALMMPNKYFRFFPLGEGRFTVNNRIGAPMDWKSLLHFYDNTTIEP